MEPNADSILEAEGIDTRMHAISRRSFLWAGAAVVGAGLALHFFDAQEPLKSEPDSIIWPLRRVEQVDDLVTSSLYSPHILSKTYADKDITEARVNGTIGLEEAFDPTHWNLDLEGATGGPQILTLDSIRALPREEFVTEFKCIEGWSYFMKWAGARFADFYAKYPPEHETHFLAVETPGADASKGQGYYVSLDISSALNPQTLLCYEMNSQPLAAEHGAPLRLILPHKYGVKNFKRIGKIRYCKERPLDYWEQQGYDGYLGL